MATQVERSAATREKTITATIECLAERGYAGASIAAVAERAGISRGAVSHQYPDKASLVVDVVEEIAGTYIGGLTETLAAIPAGRGRIEQGLDELWQAFKTDIYAAALEVYVGARTDPELHPRVLQLEADVDETLRVTIRAITGPTDSPEELDLRADVLINTLRGLGLLYATRAPAERLERVWELARADAAEALLALGR